MVRARGFGGAHPRPHQGVLGSLRKVFGGGNAWDRALELGDYFGPGR